MNKFKAWLNANPGLPQTLQKKLAVNATAISNVKNERRPIPFRWIDLIAKHSGGKLSHEWLINWRTRISLMAREKAAA